MSTLFDKEPRRESGTVHRPFKNLKKNLNLLKEGERKIYIDENNSIRIVNLDRTNYPLADVMKRLCSKKIKLDNNLVIEKDEDGFLHAEENQIYKGTLGYHLKAHCNEKEIVFKNWSV